MVWCHQATSHYLSQCWPRSLSPYDVSRPQWVNSIAPGRCSSNFKSMIFNFFIIQASNTGTRCETALRWMPLNLTNEESTLVQVMAWCHQASSHYLNRCWPKFYEATWCHSATMSLFTQCWNWNLLEELGQYHGCWCPGSLRHQIIGSNGIDITDMSDKWIQGRVTITNDVILLVNVFVCTNSLWMSGVISKLSLEHCHFKAPCSFLYLFFFPSLRP